MTTVDCSIRVEFYGIPRQRAGTESATVPRGDTRMDLGQLIGELALRFPQMARECFDGSRLRDGYIANVDGQQFITDPHTILPPGASVLILSADAGG